MAFKAVAIMIAIILCVVIVVKVKRMNDQGLYRYMHLSHSSLINSLYDKENQCGYYAALDFFA